MLIRLIRLINSYTYKSRTCNDITSQKYLVLTSLLFIIPSKYSNYKKKYILSKYYLGTGIISSMYWIKPTIGLGRNIDITNSIIYFLYCTKKIYEKKLYKNLINNIIYFYTIFNFLMSAELFKKKKNIWLNYHIIFHIMIIFGSVKLIKEIT